MSMNEAVKKTLSRFMRQLFNLFETVYLSLVLPTVTCLVLKYVNYPKFVQLCIVVDAATETDSWCICWYFLPATRVN